MAHSKLEALKSRIARVKEHATEAMGEAIKLAETTAAAGGFAWANGRYGQPDPKKPGSSPQMKVAGMPADLGTGVILHLASFGGLLGKHKEHGHNLGNGAIASYVVPAAMLMGQQAATKANAAQFSKPQAFSASGYGNPWAQQQQAAYQGVG